MKTLFTNQSLRKKTLVNCDFIVSVSLFVFRTRIILRKRITTEHHRSVNLFAYRITLCLVSLRMAVTIRSDLGSVVKTIYMAYDN